MWKKDKVEIFAQNSMVQRHKTSIFQKMSSSNIFFPIAECSNLTNFYQSHFQKSEVSDVRTKSFDAEIYNLNYEIDEDDFDSSNAEEDYSPCKQSMGMTSFALAATNNKDPSIVIDSPKLNKSE